MNNNILDKKPKDQLIKHKNNFYRSKLINRNIIHYESCEPFTLKNKDLYFKVNIKNFTGFEGNKYYTKNNPLVNTAIQLINNKDLNDNDSYLFNYFNIFQPKTYGEVYYLNKDNKLHELESTNHFHPWIHKLPTNTFRAGLFGPKDITNVEIRLIRLKNIINNINEFGYIPSKDDIIEGYILLKKDDYRFLITGGHHRIAVIIAMHMMNINKDKYGEIIVKYEKKRTNVKIVKEEDVNNWPGVKSGYLSSNDALEMFNHYFL